MFLISKFGSKKKEILNNILSLGSIEIIGILIPIVTMPIITRAVGASLYGQYLLLVTIINFGYTIIDYGVQYSGVREVVRVKKDNDLVRIAYEKYQGLRLVLCVAFYIFSSIYISLFVESSIKSLYYSLGFCYLIGYVLTSSWFFQAIGQSRVLFKTTFISRVVFFVGIVFFVSDKEDIAVVFAFYSIPVFLASLYLIFVARKKYGVSLFRLDGVCKELKNGFDIFFGLLAPNFYNAIPSIFLGTVSSPIEFAKFAVATRLANVIYTFLNVISKAVYPIISAQEKTQLKKLVFVNVLICIGIFLGVYLLGDFVIVGFFGKEFEGANNYLKILAFSMIFVGISNSFSQGYFLVKNQDHIFRNVALFVSVFSAFVSYVLISKYSFFGAVYGLLSARLMFALSYYVVYIKDKRNSNLTSRI